MFKHLEITGADGVRLHAVTEGERGQVILFLHGFPECWMAWHRQIPFFAANHRAVALDLRGYNLSDKPPGTANYALPKIADDIRHVLHRVSPNLPAIVVGHDWGGMASWLLARAHPELISRLVIINAPHPALFYRELKHNWRQRLASAYAAFFQLPALPEITLRAFDYAVLRRMIFGSSANPAMFTPEVRAEYREAWNRPHALTSALNYYRNVRALRRTVLASGNWQVDVPTLVLWGEKDPALVASNLDGLEGFVPRLTVRRHPSATHWIAHEEPDWVNESIRRFIASD